MTQDPWETIEEQYPVGSIVEGEVSKITNFGAFVKLPTGIEGLVHNSELSDSRTVKKVEEFLTVDKMLNSELLTLIKKNANWA